MPWLLQIRQTKHKSARKRFIKIKIANTSNAATLPHSLQLNSIYFCFFLFKNVHAPMGLSKLVVDAIFQLKYQTPPISNRIHHRRGVSFTQNITNDIRFAFYTFFYISNSKMERAKITVKWICVVSKLGCSHITNSHSSSYVRDTFVYQ